MKMNLKRNLLSATGILCLVFTMPVFAHAMLEGTSPADKAVLKVSPKTIDFKFGHPTKLTNVKLISASQEKYLPVNVSAPNSTTFSVPLPDLIPGSYKVNWGSLSGDGHAVTGNFTFTISGH